jgi:hypothetical protein
MLSPRLIYVSLEEKTFQGSSLEVIKKSSSPPQLRLAIPLSVFNIEELLGKTFLALENTSIKNVKNSV